MEKLLEHDDFKLKQLKRWLGENTILVTRVRPNGNYALMDAKCQLCAASFDVGGSLVCFLMLAFDSRS